MLQRQPQKQQTTQQQGRKAQPPVTPWKSENRRLCRPAKMAAVVPYLSRRRRRGRGRQRRRQNLRKSWRRGSTPPFIAASCWGVQTSARNRRRRSRRRRRRRQRRQNLRKSLPGILSGFAPPF